MLRWVIAVLMLASVLSGCVVEPLPVHGYGYDHDRDHERERHDEHHDWR